MEHQLHKIMVGWRKRLYFETKEEGEGEIDFNQFYCLIRMEEGEGERS